MPPAVGAAALGKADAASRGAAVAAAGGLMLLLSGLFACKGAGSPCASAHCCPHPWLPGAAEASVDWAQVRPAEPLHWRRAWERARHWRRHPLALLHVHVLFSSPAQGSMSSVRVAIVCWRAPAHEHAPR